MRDAIHHESALVGLAIYDPSVIDRQEVALRGYRFVDTEAGAFWSMLVRLRSKGFPIADTRMLGIECKSNGIGLDVMTRLVKEAALVGQDEYHTSELLQWAERNRLKALAAQLLAKAEDHTQPVAATSEWLRDNLDLRPAELGKRNNTVGDYLHEVCGLSELGEGEKPRCVQTGIVPLDNKIGGFRGGQMILLAARTGLGKSALAQQIATYVAECGNEVLFISLEMSGAELAARLAAHKKAISMRSILDGNLPANVVADLKRLADECNKHTRMYIEDRSGLSMRRIETLVRQYSTKRKLGLVVIDYIGLIMPERRTDDERASLSRTSNAIKRLAKSEGVPILCLAQLNRDSEKDPVKITVPTLAQIRNCGDLEQDSDLILFLHRESRNAAKGKLILAKGRNFGTGHTDLDYNGPRYEFTASIQQTGEPRESPFAKDFA